MLSQKTQRYLCDLLFEIAKGEKQVEVVRQLLGEQEAFVPYSAFRRLDEQRKKYINSYDIKDFLAENGFPRSLQDCELFIRAYDADQDTKISYQEFLSAVLPYENQSLREIVSQRHPFEIRSGERLPCDTEYTLAKLIDREIQCNLQILEKKAFLETRYDYSVADCFNTIDVNNKKVLDGRDFYAFFRKNGQVSYEDEIISLHRRLDYDQDNYISYEDFFLGISKQETLQKAEIRNPHEHQIIASPYRKTLSSRSPFTDRKSLIFTQQTPRSNLKEKLFSLQSSQKKNVKIMSPSKYDDYSHLITEIYASSPFRENSRLRHSTGFKHSPAKSILKNSINKMELEKNLLRNELQLQKQIDLLHQSNYSSRNTDLKDDPSYYSRDQIRSSSREARVDQIKTNRGINQQDIFIEMEKDRLIEREREIQLSKEKQKLLELEKEKLIQQEKERLFEIERQKIIEKEKERIFERERLLERERSLERERLLEQERLLEREREKQYLENIERKEREEKLRILDYEEREIERQRRLRDQEEYDYQIQKMRAAEKEQQMKLIERENQIIQQQQLKLEIELQQQQIQRENELKQQKIDIELRQREKERQLQQIELEKKLARKQAEKNEQENQEKERKQMQLEAEKRLQEIENEQKQRKLNKIKQQQEKEERERKLKEEEKSIREQIDYERYLKQKLEEEKRIDKGNLNDLRSKSCLGSFDKNQQQLNSHPQSSIYSQSKTASFEQRSPLESYTIPKRFEDNQISKNHESASYNTRCYPSYNKSVSEHEALDKPIERSLYSRQPFDQTNKFDRPSYTSPIDLRETYKSRTPTSSTVNYDRNKDDLYQKQQFSTCLKSQLTRSNNRKSLDDYNIEDLLVTQFLDVISSEKKSERARQEVALRPDFKLGDLYKVLDKTKKGNISSLNFEQLLKKLNMTPSMNDIYLLMRRYDLDNDGQLRFSDIAEALTPKQIEYAKLLNKRESILEGEVTIDEVYSFETLKLLKELFMTLIESEQIVESIRNELKLKKEFSFQDTFSLIDVDQDGFITQQELQVFFEKNNVVCSDKELQMLIQRFDQDRDNKISFGEFVQELSPKSNIY